MTHEHPMCRAKTARVRLQLVFLGVALISLGCSSSDTQESGVVRDSAGITIVESLRPDWEDSDPWRIEPTPTLEIGTTDGLAHYQFFRIEGLARLPGGEIVVADGGANEIRFFDSSGVFLSLVGGTGDAPGEYRMLSALGYGPGDSLWAFDYGNRRFTVLSNAGETVRTVSVGGWLSAVGPVGRLPDGSFVVKEGWGSGASSVPARGLRRDPVAVAVATPDGSSWDTVGMFPGREVFVSLEDGRQVMSAPLYAHNTSAAILGADVVVGIQDEMEVAEFSVDGTISRILRVLGENLRLTATEIERRRTEVLLSVPEDRRVEMARGIEMMDIPRSRPAYGRIVVAGDESIWLAEESRYPAIPTKWTVISSDGFLLGEMTMPDGFSVFQVGIDWILGVGRDELDVEYVRMYRIVK